MNYLFTYFKKPEKRIFKTAKTCLVLFALLFLGSLVSAQTEFITEWKTNNPGNSANNQITIPAVGTFNYTWKRIGTSTTGSGNGNGTTLITFSSPGNYEVKMTPSGAQPLNGFKFSQAADDKKKLVKLTQWGSMKWTSLNNAFYGAENLKITATDLPNLTVATNMSFAFAYCGADNIPNLKDWNISSIKDMSYAFAAANLYNMDHITFNNNDLGGWDVRHVTTMEGMFQGNVNYNPNISKWNVSKVTDMSFMFNHTYAFNRDIGGWDISKVTTMQRMFDGPYVNLSCENYSKTLAGWAANDARTPSNINLVMQNFKYSSEVVKARNHLINSRGWTITGDSQNTDACPIDFVTEWNTLGESSIIIPATGEFIYSWKNINNVSQKDDGYGLNNTTINFSTAGTYEIRILPIGQSPFSLNFGTSTSTNQKKLSKITQWGATAWSKFSSAFEGTSNLNITATDRPNLDNVVSMYDAFRDSGITTIPNLPQWNFRNIINTTGMFNAAANFNQDLSGLNVSNVKKMDFMFAEAFKFNQNISTWNVSNVTSMYAMFYKAADFNQDISSWDTSNVIDMTNMFNEAALFNQNIGNWDTSKVMRTHRMFWEATAFDQNLGSWNLATLQDANDMFTNNGLGCINYSKTLQGWANNTNTMHGVSFGADGRSYSAEAVSDRNQLINNKNWTITGDSQGSCSLGAMNTDLTNLKLFPNPVTDFLTINGLEGGETLTVYDMNGRLMQNSKANGKEVKLNLSLYVKGMYLLNISSDKGTTTKKIIKQ